MGEFGGDPLVPMVNRLNTIFGGLADTYREQGREYGRPSQHPPTPQHDVPDPDERAPDEPHEFGPTGRLFPRDADGPQPMAPPLGTLGEYVAHFASIEIPPLGIIFTDLFLVFSSSSSKTLVKEDSLQDLEVPVVSVS